MSNLPDILRHLRRQSGLSLAEAAQRLGISRANVNHYETGVRTPPSGRLPDLARIYGGQFVATPAGWEWKKLSTKSSARS
jgi:transcriptional regulator with XRE-family HTH domain